MEIQEATKGSQAKDPAAKDVSNVGLDQKLSSDALAGPTKPESIDSEPAGLKEMEGITIIWTKPWLITAYVL